MCRWNLLCAIFLNYTSESDSLNWLKRKLHCLQGVWGPAIIFILNPLKGRTLWNKIKLIHMPYTYIHTHTNKTTLVHPRVLGQKEELRLSYLGPGPQLVPTYFPEEGIYFIIMTKMNRTEVCDCLTHSQDDWCW